MRYYLIIFTFSLFIPLSLAAQERKPSPKAYELMDQAKKQMEEGEYKLANLTFRRILKLKTVLPTEMSYLFAETLFKIGQYENSMNFLKKYQNLTDRGSDYYPQAVSLEKQLVEKLEEIKACQLCNVFGYRLTPCEVCNMKGTTVQPCNLCRAHGIIACPACIGSGVIISVNQFNEKEYRSCEKCQSKGFITCHVCEGKKEIATFCPTCNGIGYKSTDLLCDHLPQPGN